MWVVENLRHRDDLNLRLLMVRGVVLSNHSSPLGGRGANSAVGSSKYVKGGYDRTPACTNSDHPWILINLGLHPTKYLGLSLRLSAITGRIS